MDEDKICKNCGDVISKTNYAMGPEWAHINPNAGFPTEQKGSAWRYCRITTAEPEEK